MWSVLQQRMVRLSEERPDLSVSRGGRWEGYEWTLMSQQNRRGVSREGRQGFRTGLLTKVFLEDVSLPL